jgi:hypothetical protein
MIINNFTEMNNFLNSNGLNNFGGRLSICINEYSKICSCKPNEKSAKLMECENNYIASINTIASNKALIFNKIRDNSIEFKRNGQTIIIITK